MAPSLDLSSGQELTLREIAGRFGIGCEIDSPSGAGVDIIASGAAWEIAAAAKTSSVISAKIFAGSPHRMVSNEERTYLAEEGLISSVDHRLTEYDASQLIARGCEGFAPLDEEEVLPFGYDIHSRNSVMKTATSQFIRIGHVGDGSDIRKGVIMMHIDQYQDRVSQADGTRHSKHLLTVDIMSIVSRVLSQGGDDKSSIGLVASGTYASNRIATVLAGLREDRRFALGTYSRETLASVKGEGTPSPVDIDQITGELRAIYDMLNILGTQLTR